MSLVAPRTFLVHVVGFVTKPGIYVANPFERVSTVLQNSGGIASRRRVDIERRTGTVLRADLGLYELTGEVRYNPYVMDGDVIRVPWPGITVTVGGPVKRPGSYELIDTKDLKEALTMAAGLRPTVARELPIRVVHRNKQNREEQRLIQFPPSGDVPNFPLSDGDDVIFPSVTELQRSVILVGALASGNPADEATAVKRLPYVEGDTVRSLLERAGGVGPGADLAGAYIKRGASGDVVPIDLEALLVKRDFGADRPVGMGDTVVVPYKRRGILVQGAVLRPGVVQYNPTFSIDEYVGTAGGETRLAQRRGNVKVITSQGRTKANRSGLRIEPGDTIVVPERTFAPSEVVQLVMGGVGIAISAFTLVYLVTHK